MKLIESSYEFAPQAPEIEGMYKQVELGARCCYNSQHLITEDSYKTLIDSLKKRKHYSPFAHGTVYLKLDKTNSDLADRNEVFDHYLNNFWSRVVINNDTAYITSNMRVLLENGWEEDLKFWSEPTEYHIKRITIKFNSSIGVSREINRHSVSLSVCEQSTRYCNYSKDKFGNELTFVIPEWVKTRINDTAESFDPLTWRRKDYLVNMSIFKAIDCMCAEDRAINCWIESLKRTEDDYMYLLSDECCLKPEEARGVLDLDLATEVYYTGYINDWKHVFEMRTNPAAHPDARAICCPLEAEFKLKGYIE